MRRPATAAELAALAGTFQAAADRADELDLPTYQRTAAKAAAELLSASKYSTQADLFSGGAERELEVRP